MVGNYQVSYCHPCLENKGSIIVHRGDGKKLVALKSLTLWLAGSKMWHPTGKRIPLTHLHLGRKHLLVDQAKLAKTIVAAKSNSDVPSEIDSALSLIGIQKSPVQKIQLSSSDFAQIASSLREDGSIQAASAASFVLKEQTTIIEQILQYSKKTVKSYPDMSLEILFRRNEDGKVTIKIFRFKKQVYPKKTPSLPLKPPSIMAETPSLIKRKAIHAPPIQVMGIGAGVAQGSITIDNPRIHLSGLTLWKKKDTEQNVPEMVLEGVVSFTFEDEILLLSVKSLIASLATASRGNKETQQCIVRNLESIGIVRHQIIPWVIDEVAVQQALYQASIPEWYSPQIINFFLDNHSSLSERLSWSTDAIKERKEISHDMHFTIRARRSEIDMHEIFEVTFFQIGIGHDKVTKTIATFSSREVKVLAKSRVRTKEGGKSRTSKEIAESTEKVLHDVEISNSLIEHGALFIRRSLTMQCMTHHGFLPKLFHELCPESLESRIQSIHTKPSFEKVTAIRDLLPYLCCVLHALKQIHSQGICHRDLKGGNLLITLDGRPRIIDFGEAEEFSKKTDESQEMLHGTAGYIAPECFFLPTIDRPEAIDMFAFAVILIRLVHDRSPFADLQQKYWNESSMWRSGDFQSWHEEFAQTIRSTQFFVQQHAGSLHFGSDIKELDFLIDECVEFHRGRRLSPKEALARLLKIKGVAAKYHEMIKKETA
jgi:serine/threonine protein kinase